MNTDQKPAQFNENELALMAEFKTLLEKFSDVLLEKLMANERKYGFGNSWKLPDWEKELQHDLLHHIQKGDPRDVAIYSLFAWYHGWRTAAVENDKKLEAAAGIN